MRSVALAAYAAVAVLTLTACGEQAPADSVRHDWDGAWVLTSGNDTGVPLVLVPTHPVTLVLVGDDVSGIAACNHYGGTITRNGGSIAFGAMSMTEMACSPESAMTLEAAYHAALADVTTATIDGDTLVLSGAGTRLTFAFEPPPPTAELLGTTWLLDSLITGDAASSVAGKPTLQLRADGTVSGSTGCRSFEGTWTEHGARLDFPELTVTDQACTPALVDQDDHVLSVLGDGFTAAIDGPTLTVSDPDGNGLVYRAKD